jgi:hypothetical protein
MHAEASLSLSVSLQVSPCDVARMIHWALGNGPALGVHLGQTVQVDPIKPTLKAPGNKRLKLECNELLSIFAFKFNLRRYTSEAPARSAVGPALSCGWQYWLMARAYRVWGAGGAGRPPMVRRCSLTP